MGVIDQIGSALASGVSSTIGNLPGAAINFGLNTLMQNQQVAKSKDLMKYQWDNYLSPKAQVESMAAAGLNPAVTLGGHGSFASPSVAMPSNNAPIQVDGVSDMLGSLTQLKKVDKENELVDQQIYKTLAEQGLIEAQREGQNIANIIAAQFGDKKAAAEVANIGAQAALYSSQEQQVNAEKELSKLKAKTEFIYQGLLEQNKYEAALKVKNYQRYIDSVVSSNKASATASYASAEESRSNATLHRANAKYQDIVNDIKESGKVFELENIIQRWRSENKINQYQYENGKFWLRRMSKLNKQLTGDDLKSRIEQEMDDFFWYWKDEVPNIEMPTFMIPLK